MNKHKISDSFYYVLCKDRTGETIRTNVFYKKEEGIYEAYSSYENDIEDDLTGFGESHNDEKAIRQSISHLHKEWREYLKEKGLQELPFKKSSN